MGTQLWEAMLSYMCDRPCPTVTTFLASLLLLAFVDSLVFMLCISPFFYFSHSNKIF